MCKLRTVCCLVLLCVHTGGGGLVKGAVYHPSNSNSNNNHQKSRHQVFYDALNAQDMGQPEDNNVISHQHVKGRSSAMTTITQNDLVPALRNNQVDDLILSLHRSEDNARRGVGGGVVDSHNNNHNSKWSTTHSDNSNNVNLNIQFLENFYVKELRIEMQKSQILHSFPPDELPTAMLEERDDVQSEDVSAENSLMGSWSADVDEDVDHDDQKMLEFVRQVGSSIEQNDAELQQQKTLDELARGGGWMDNLRPIYRFIKDHMEKFDKELKEHKRKIERVWKQEQQERDALEREDGDEPFETRDFEREIEKREIIFLDEGNY